MTDWIINSTFVIGVAMIAIATSHFVWEKSKISKRRANLQHRLEQLYKVCTS
jgi:hypothetical protein